MNKKIYKPCEIKGINETAGTIEFYLTRRQVDRDSEVVEPSGLILDEFLKNPVFLWAHSRTAPSIGRVIPESIVKTQDHVLGTVEFDLDDPLAKMIFGKYVKGHLNAVSIGFIPKEADRPVFDGQRGPTFTESVLLELSGVPIPSNAGALAIRSIADEVDGEWHDILQKFYEVAGDDITAANWCSWMTKSANPEPPASSGSTIAVKGIPPIIENLIGSYQWIISGLRRSAKSWLSDNEVVTQIDDWVAMIATYKGEAVICHIGMDRPFSEDQCFRGKYKIRGESVEWQGEPELVELQASVVPVVRAMAEEIRGKAIQFTPGVVAPSIEKLFVASDWDAQKATDRLKAWAAGDYAKGLDLTSQTHRALFSKGFAAVLAEGKEAKDFVFPHHDVIDGELRLSAKGVAAAMVDLFEQIEKGQMSDEVALQIYEHLKQHYFDMGKDAPEFPLQSDTTEPEAGQGDDEQGATDSPEEGTEIELTDEQISQIAQMIAAEA